MASLEVEVNPLELNAPGATNWDATEFELYDSSGRALLQTVPGEGTPPDHATFTGLDQHETYQYRARVHDAQYGWSDWSDNCIYEPVKPEHILAPEMELVAGTEPGSIEVNIAPMKIEKGEDTAKSLTISVSNAAGEKLQEYVLDGEPDSFTFTGLPTGTYTVAAHWTGNLAGDGDEGSETISIENDPVNLLAPDFTITAEPHGFILNLSLPLKTDKDGVTDNLASVRWVLYQYDVFGTSTAKVIDTVTTAQQYHAVRLLSSRQYKIECYATGQKYGDAPVTVKQAFTLGDSCSLDRSQFSAVADVYYVDFTNKLFGDGNQLSTICADVFDNWYGTSYFITGTNNHNVLSNFTPFDIYQGVVKRFEFLAPDTAYSVSVIQVGEVKGNAPQSFVMTVRTKAGIRILEPAFQITSLSDGVIRVEYLPANGTSLATTSADVFDTFNGLEVCVKFKLGANSYGDQVYWNADMSYTRDITLPKPADYHITVRLRGKNYGGSRSSFQDYTYA